MNNIAFSRPNLSNPKLGGSYLKNFKLALINWELNRQEDQQGVVNKRNKKQTQTH